MTPAAPASLLARRMGKRRLIAETGAGQHGVATAIVGALLGFETVIYMGAEDVDGSFGSKADIYLAAALGGKQTLVKPPSARRAKRLNTSRHNTDPSNVGSAILLASAMTSGRSKPTMRSINQPVSTAKLSR